MHMYHQAVHSLCVRVQVGGWCERFADATRQSCDLLEHGSELTRNRSWNNRLVACPIVGTATAEKEHPRTQKPSSGSNPSGAGLFHAGIEATSQGAISGMKSVNSLGCLQCHTNSLNHRNGPQQAEREVEDGSLLRTYLIPHGRSMAMSTASDSVRGAVGSTLQCRRRTRHMRSWAGDSICRQAITLQRCIMHCRY